MEITNSVLQSIKNNINDKCIIYLSGPSSLNTPEHILRSNNVIAVNGSVGFLQNNNIPVFAYVVCDGSYYENNKSLFFKYSSYSKYTFISPNVLNRASTEEKEILLKSCYLLKDLCKSRGGLGRKIRYTLKTLINRNIFIKCSYSRKIKTIGFSKDITYGQYGSATVAFTALQLAITLKFKNIYFSGLDMKGKCQRFYKEEKPQPTSLIKDFDLILESFTFLMKNHQGNIYNLSQETAIPYEIIPFINIDQIGN